MPCQLEANCCAHVVDDCKQKLHCGALGNGITGFMHSMHGINQQNITICIISVLGIYRLHSIEHKEFCCPQASRAGRAWPPADLLPPVPRPKTSAVVAQRLIGHALNLNGLRDKVQAVSISRQILWHGILAAQSCILPLL